MTDCDFCDEVEFEAGTAKDGCRYKSAQKVILVKLEKMEDGNISEKEENKKRKRVFTGRVSGNNECQQTSCF